MNRNMKTAPIGVTDSGVGGLTVVRRLQELLPGEDIVYFGDSANCPYGNRSREELTALFSRNVEFLKAKGVKAVVVACNTTSALLDSLQRDFGVPMLTIIAPAARAVQRCGAKRVGLIATEFTVASGSYERQIHALCPETEVIAAGSPNLAGLIDRGETDGEAVDAEIAVRVGDVLRRGAVSHLILGCTHYPIVEGRFRACFPQLELIDPAREEAAAAAAALGAADLVNPAAKGRFTIYTSGETAVYEKVAAQLALTPPDSVEKLSL